MDIIIAFAIFAFIALASKEIGKHISKIQLPLITGYLIAGILAGRFALNLIPESTVRNLIWVDEISLAFIAFAAGSELSITDLRTKLRSLSWLTFGVSFLTFTIGTVVFYFVSSSISILAGLGVFEKVAVSMMMASILIARSPSSAIAIIQELRAKGPFTQVTLGVTILSDVVVIFVFAFTASVADAAFEGIPISLTFFILLILELIGNIVLGIILSQFMKAVLSLKIHSLIKTGALLLSGYSIYLFSGWLRQYSALSWEHEFLIEPLLVCMVASFIVVNYSKHRSEFLQILHTSGPLVYIAFFTLTGASLELDTLLATWGIALALFGARLIGIITGSFFGGKISRAPAKHNNLYWMAFLTQAGVGLGLAKDVAIEFPQLGSTFATIAIAVIVINQVIGPPFHKLATRKVGESHEKADSQDFDGVRDALIFGLEDQSLALARELLAHEWQVKIAHLPQETMPKGRQNGIEIIPIQELSPNELDQLQISKADTVVTMLTDEENYCLVDCIYENFGIKNVVVRVNNRECIDRFHELDALTVHPSTAMVNLLEHFVRSPNAVSLLLGSETEQDRDVVEIEISDPDIHDIAVRDLNLPMDTLLLQISRKGETLISQGYTRLQLGDRVSILGSETSLQEVIRRFEK
jgi:Trk K+ transport system NAD-binding subunit/Kef-type K+ transport system membrane component KefB